MIGTFQSSLFWYSVVPSVVCCCTVLLLLWVLIEGIHASGISISMFFFYKKRFKQDFTQTISTGIVVVVSGKLLFHMTFNRNFRIFWLNGKHPRTARIKMCQSQLLKTSLSQQSIMLCKVSPSQSTLSPDEV